MLTCRNVSEHASASLDETLPFWTRVGVRLHLLICVDCQRYLAQLRIVSAVTRTPVPGPAGDAVEATLGALMAQKKNPPA